ncbi:hypothetical protein [Pseudomonas sp. 3-2]|uniref:hypothetical protein n=1 Tax=Pseudomonas sp. 3-2 TaxID=2867408 RepID=UPI001C885DDA|nr:hypothetical protein [Pseudomonas sp. 3-2]QZD72071.1 hypothetical protein K3819_04225 [Pseudomonas sp. 3-2]
MKTLKVSQVVPLAPPKAPQAPDGVLDTTILQGAFLLNFDYAGKDAGQRVNITLSVKIDRFSPPIVWTTYFETQTSGDEQRSTATNMFDYRFRDGSVEIWYTATIAGQSHLSVPLVLSIVDTVGA